MTLLYTLLATLSEHSCVVCAQLRPGEPRIYDRPSCCEGCRSRLRSMLAELLEAYSQLELVKGSTAGAKVSGSRTPPLPLAVTALDLTMPARPDGVSEATRLVPQYETVPVEVEVWVPASPDAEYRTETVVMNQRQPTGSKGPTGDQVGHPGVASVLDSWARDWQTYRPGLLPAPDVSSLTGWLTQRLEWACDQHPAVDDFAAELRSLVGVVRSAAGMTRPKAEVKFGVPCRDCEKVTLFRWPGSDYVECGSCPVLMTPEEYQNWTHLISAPEWHSWVEEAVGVEEDIRLVAQFLREHYGRTIDHIGTPTTIARGVVGRANKDGRLGDGEAVDDDWEPTIDDVEEFTHAGVGGMVRLWRAQEIAHYALIALARAGRLLPRPEIADRSAA